MAEGGSLASIIVTISADASEFVDGLRKASEQAKEFAAAGAALAATGAAIVGSMLEMSHQVATAGTQFDLMSQRVGTSASQLSALSFAGKQTGVDIDTLVRSMQLLSKNVDDTTGANAKTTKALESLGIATKDSNGNMRDAQSIMLDVATAFSGMKDGTDKTAEAMAIFGKGGAAMIPFLNEGRDGIEALTKKAGDLGIVFSDTGAKAAHEYEDAQNALTASFTGLEKTIGEQVMPTFKAWMETATDIVKSTKDWTAAHPDLTKEVLFTSEALIGTGGLLLGIAGVTAAIPLLTTAFAALTAGMAAIPIAALVASFGALALAGKDTKQAVDDSKAAELGAAEASDKLHDRIVALGGPDIKMLNGNFGEWNTKLIQVFKSMQDTNPALIEYHANQKAMADQTEATRKVIAATEEALTTHTAAVKKDYEALLFDIGVTQDATRIMNEQITAIHQSTSEFHNWMVSVDDGTLAATHAEQALLKLTAAALANTSALGPEVFSIWRERANQISDIFSTATVNLNNLGTVAVSNAGLVSTTYVSELKKATEDVSRSAGKVFDDMFIKGQDVFSSLQNMLKGGVLSLGRTLFEDIAGALLGPVKQAFNDFFKGLISGPMTGFGQELGNTIKSALGGSGGGLGGVGGSSGGGLGGLGDILGIGALAAGAYALGGAIFGGHQSDYSKWVEQVQQTGFTVVRTGVAEKFDGQGGISASTWYTGSYAAGTPYVQQTGPAWIHQGERITTASDNQQLVPLLQAILGAIQGGHDIYIDNQKMVSALYRGNRFGTLQLTGAR